MRISSRRRGESFSVVETATESTLVRVTWHENVDEFFELVVEAGGVVLEATGTADMWTTRLRFEKHDDLSAFFRGCVQRGLSLDFRRVDNPGHPGSTGPYEELTDAQRETIHLAFKEGYFAVPREITLQELAAELEISDTAVSQRLRRGITTFLSSKLRDIYEYDQSLTHTVSGHREENSPIE